MVNCLMHSTFIYRSTYLRQSLICRRYFFFFWQEQIQRLLLDFEPVNAWVDSTALIFLKDAKNAIKLGWNVKMTMLLLSLATGGAGETKHTNCCMKITPGVSLILLLLQVLFLQALILRVPRAKMPSLSTLTFCLSSISAQERNRAWEV